LKKIGLLHAELSDYSYDTVKLEAYARAPDAQGCVMNYSVGCEFASAVGVKVSSMDNQEIIRFVTLLKKHSGLASEGLSFSFSLPSSIYKADVYRIGGKHGEVLMADVSIKHHRIYLHNRKLTGTVLIKPSPYKKIVRFVCFNDTHSFVQEAQYKENIPYSEIELWEYMVEYPDENLAAGWMFYVELIEDTHSQRDDNFHNFFSLGHGGQVTHRIWK
jgi:hypothetical protein